MFEEENYFWAHFVGKMLKMSESKCSIMKLPVSTIYSIEWIQRFKLKVYHEWYE